MKRPGVGREQSTFTERQPTAGLGPSARNQRGRMRTPGNSVNVHSVRAQRAVAVGMRLTMRTRTRPFVGQEGFQRSTNG